jgi:hypothetical protein
MAIFAPLIGEKGEAILGNDAAKNIGKGRNPHRGFNKTPPFVHISSFFYKDTR